jgi:hypothetical protein
MKHLETLSQNVNKKWAKMGKRQLLPIFDFQLLLFTKITMLTTIKYFLQTFIILLTTTKWCVIMSYKNLEIKGGEL